MGIDPTVYRDFISGRHWPRPRTRAKIEVALGWPVGTLARMARGEPPPGVDAGDPVTEELLVLREAVVSILERLDAALERQEQEVTNRSQSVDLRHDRE